MKFITPLMPALLAFGPLFLLMGVGAGSYSWISYVGAIMMTIGSLVLFVNQQRLLQRMDEDEK